MNEEVVVKTKKAAREAGMKTADCWLGQRTQDGSMYPKREAVGMGVKDEVFYTKEQCEQVLSKTRAKKKSLKVPWGTVPVGTKNWYPRGEYSVFRISDCVPKKDNKADEPENKRLMIIANLVSGALGENIRYNSRMFSDSGHADLNFSADNKHLAHIGFQICDNGTWICRPSCNEDRLDNALLWFFNERIVELVPKQQPRGKPAQVHESDEPFEQVFFDFMSKPRRNTRKTLAATLGRSEVN